MSRSDDTPYDEQAALLQQFFGGQIIGLINNAARASPVSRAKVARFVELAMEPHTDVSVDLMLEGHADRFISYLVETIDRAENEDRIEVNRCPSCDKIVRTQSAKQCLWCGHDWH